MEKQVEIMGKLSEIEFSMESLACVLKTFEDSYELKNEYEMKKNIRVIKKSLESILFDLRESMDVIDNCISYNKEN